MKALFELFRRFDARRIFGFIRRLGGMSRPKVKCYDLRSTRALRVEGDLDMPEALRLFVNFYPRPPGRGRHKRHMAPRNDQPISIHALRVEGDSCRTLACTVRLYFYPRPPGGGRHALLLSYPHLDKISIHALRVEGDRRQYHGIRRAGSISIHALRVEGDHFRRKLEQPLRRFLSTPSGWKGDSWTPHL